MRKNILISTGGSGGHVIPATILKDHLSKTNEVIISTDKRGFKYLDVSKYKEAEIIDTPRIKNIFLFPFNLVRILFLSIKSFFLLKNKNIDRIISTGGYMSLPLILAAKLLKLKIYLFEPNLILGRANKFFINSCEKIICYTSEIKNFPKNLKNKIEIIDPLVRKEFYNKENKNFIKKKFNILVIGGSQGAAIFDNNLKKIITKIAKEFPIKIVQQTNERNIANLEKFYSENKIENTVFNYDKNFINKILETDLCITRSGSSTLAELSITNTPFVAVPLATSKDNHQLENANFYKKKGCCWLLEQSVFEEEIEQLLKDILKNKMDYLKKKQNLEKLNYQNTWINVNQKILNIINEN